MVSDASRASSAADFRMSRRALSAWLTLSLARLIAAPCVLRSSADILPSVANSAEIEPFLPSAATRTASRAASSPAAAIWLRMVCSRLVRSDTVQISVAKGRWLWPRRGRKVKAKKVRRRAGEPLFVNPFWLSSYQHGFRERAMSLKAWLTGPAILLALCTAPAEASICQGKSMTLDETVDAIKATRGCERAMRV